MKKPCFLLASTLLLISCNNDNDNPSSEEDGSVSPVKCFAYTNPKDTIVLKLIPLGDAVTGTLVYMLDGKDKNSGTIEGMMRDDLLIADYTFISEGIRSVRQVAFLKKDSFYIEGYGDIITRGNRVQFSNTDSLWFNDSIRLLPTGCGN